MWGQEGHLVHLGSREFKASMEFKGQRATWDHLVNLDLQVNRGTQAYRASLVHRGL